MKKQYIQPATDISKMVCIHSILENSGINTGSGSQYTGGNTDPDDDSGQGTKERSGWGSLGDEQVSYGHIW